MTHIWLPETPINLHPDPNGSIINPKMFESH